MPKRSRKKRKSEGTAQSAFLVLEQVTDLARDEPKQISLPEQQGQDEGPAVAHTRAGRQKAPKDRAPSRRTRSRQGGNKSSGSRQGR
jgi:hypothetical protein